MTPDERSELLRDLSTVAYTHIRFSGLWRELTNEEWERLADEHAEKVMELLESLVNEGLANIESEREEMEQWLNQD